MRSGLISKQFCLCPTRTLVGARGKSNSSLRVNSRVKLRSRVPQVLQAKKDEDEVVYNKDFGYSRKDVLIIGGITIGLGYGIYYGLQIFGVDELRAGSIAQLVVFVGILLTWVVTYLFRVGNKSMTYVTQLKDYEEAVMQKRLEEMTDAEIEVLMEEVEREKKEAIKAKEEK